jgi:hypothetical protein
VRVALGSAEIIELGGALRRAHLAVLVVSALTLSACSVEQRPLRRGFVQEETPTAGATVSSAPPKSTPSSSAQATAKPRPAAEFGALALPQQVLTEDGLDTRESAGTAPSTVESQCGKQVGASGRASEGYRVATRSASGASKFDQRMAAYPAGRAKDLVEAVRKPLPCGAGELELGALSGVDSAAWCEELPGGRGACSAVLAQDDTAVSLRMETISVARAREVLTRLAGSAAELLAKA